MGMLHALLKIG